MRLVAGLTVLLAAACGKKGPPLAPLIPIPAAIDQIGATRLGSDVYVTLTVPSENIDAFAPADISRIEVLGNTGRIPPPRRGWVVFGTLHATVPVAPPPAPDTPQTDAPQQGTQITIVDTLTADELVQGKAANTEPGTRDVEPGTRDVEPGTRNVEPGTGNPEPGTGNPEPGAQPSQLRRFYTAFPFNPRGRPGPPGANAELPLLPLPEPPPSLRVDYDEKAVTVTWEPSGGLLGFLLERALPEEPLPLELEAFANELEGARSADVDTRAPSEDGPILYNVYRITPPDPFAPPPDESSAAAWTHQPPAALNPAPLATFEFADAVELNRERCYVVRAVRGATAGARVGNASPPTCITAVDTFAPRPPQGLATVASEGVINLIWEPNPEPDLGGYVVLRGEAPGDTLLPLTPAPIAEARYRDAAVTPGMRYVYAVVAVDNRFPVPNLSAASESQEETAR